MPSSEEGSVVDSTLITTIYTLFIIHAVTCSKLDAPNYGKVWVTGNSYSSTAYYTCNYGYELDGSHSRRCQHDGTWYGKAPECRPVKRGKQDCHSFVDKLLAVNYNNILHSYLFQAHCTQVWQGLSDWLLLLLDSLLQL